MEVSIHFTTKTNSIVEIREKLFNDIRYQNLKDSDNLNHCFLPREEVEKREFSLDCVDFLEEILDTTTIWFTSLAFLQDRRAEMIDFIKKSNGVAIFVGDIIDGVRAEFDYAVKQGLTIWIIN